MFFGLTGLSLELGSSILVLLESEGAFFLTALPNANRLIHASRDNHWGKRVNGEGSNKVAVGILDGAQASCILCTTCVSERWKERNSHVKRR